MIYRTHNLTGCLVVLKSEASMRQFLRDRQRSVESKMRKAIVDELYKRGLAYSQQGDRRRSLVNKKIVIERDSSYAKAYYHRGVLYLHHKEWIKAKQDFTLARKGGVDIVQAFDEDFGGVVAFQQEYEFQLPSDLVHLLTDGE